MRTMKRIVILISGRGSNMQAILEVAKAEQWPVTIAAVISNRPNAGGLTTAGESGIATAVVDHQQYADRAAFDTELMRVIDSYRPDLVVLAGFMRILTEEFVLHYQGRLLNIHPSLLPAFPGLATHKRALESGEKTHGATVHFVTPDLDHGPIIEQASVPVLPDDTEDTLAERVLQQEHVIYPRAVKDFIEGRVRFVNGQVVRDGV